MRDTSGSYSLPTSPVQGGNTILASWANGTLSDLATEVTNSLDRNGRGGMLAALRGIDGTVTAPAYSFSSEGGSGLYRIGAQNLGLAINGNKRQEWTSTGTVITGTWSTTGDATVGGALGVTGNATVGGTLGVTGASTVAALTASGAVTLTGGDLTLSQAATQALSKTGGNLILNVASANSLAIKTSNLTRWTIDPAGVFTPSNGAKITSLPAPSAGSDAVTKDYVDAGPAFTGKPTAPATVAGDGATTLATKGYVEAVADSGVNTIVTAATNWTPGSGPASPTGAILPGKVIVLNYNTAAPASAPGTGFGTIVAGYRPTSPAYFVGWDQTANAAVRVKIFQDGTTEILPSPVANHVYQFTMAWKAA